MSDPNSAEQNLPAGVKMRLAAGEKIAPELHDDVAVVFTGVVGRPKHCHLQCLMLRPTCCSN